MLMIVSHDNHHLSLQRCMAVVGVFGVITIISYFNELAKAGLLYKHSPRPRERLPKSDRILQRNARFNVDLSNVQKVLQEESSHRGGKINLALHIGNNRSYEKVNASEVTVYQHRNVLHNYFLVANQTSSSSSSSSGVATYMTPATGVSVGNVTALKEAYQSAVRVLLYQHEWGGYACRDCLKSLAKEDGLVIPSYPLTTSYRQEWDQLSSRRKQRYNVLYGSLSFGVCENIAKPCNYFVLMPHPIDRIIQVYRHCKQNRSTAASDFCHFDKLNVTDVTLSRFIKHQGSGFFKKLLYYSRRCRLVGGDEVCLKDAAFSFSTQEREIHLKHILDNLHQWFSVVGLANRYNESMELFEHVFGQNFSSCPRPKPEDKSDYIKTLRQRIEKDKQAMRYLHADIAIYNRFEEIFDQQLEIHRRMINTHTTTESIKTTTAVPRARGRFHHKITTTEGKSNSTKCENCLHAKYAQKKNRTRTKHHRKKHVRSPSKGHAKRAFKLTRDLNENKKSSNLTRQ